MPTNSRKGVESTMMNRNEQVRQPPSLGSNLRYFTNATDVDNFQTLD